MVVKIHRGSAVCRRSLVVYSLTVESSSVTVDAEPCTVVRLPFTVIALLVHLTGRGCYVFTLKVTLPIFLIWNNLRDLVY